MIVSDTAIKNRISVLILSLIVILVGVYCYIDLPREDEPDITIPYVFVSTPYKGVSSSDIETSITIPIEKKMKGLEGVKKISSSSSEGISSITIEFLPGIDIDEVLQKVKDKVDEAKRDLPQDLEDDPAVFEINLSEMPIIVYSLTGPGGLSGLKEIADDIEEDIESVPGVLEVDVAGGLEREIIIEVDPDKLAYYKIPITALSGIVRNENSNTSGGAITLGEGRYQVRVPGEFDSPNEIFGLVVSSFQGKPVYLKDLATVVDSFKEETSKSRLNGRESINIYVKKRTGENVIEIIEKADVLIEHARKTWPKGTNITKLMDKSKDIRMMVHDLENNILTGLFLVVGVLLFSMGLRNALLVGVAIPFSMLISFSVLYILGITLNMVVLFSLTLALGMLVDNAIVIVENIYRFMEQGVPRMRAAKLASSEVAYPIIGSTFTTLAAFCPLMFWPGVMGDFMAYLPITLIITLSSSLFVALVINPALCSFFLKVKVKKGLPGLNNNIERFETSKEKPVQVRGTILKFYTLMLKWSLNNRFKVILISCFMLILFFEIWLLVIGLEKPIEFFPNIDPRLIYVNIEPPEGSDLEYRNRIAQKIEMAVCGTKENLNDMKTDTLEFYEKVINTKKHKTARGREFYSPSDLENIEYIYASIDLRASRGQFGPKANHIGVQFVDLEDRWRSSNQSISSIRDRVKKLTGAKIVVAKAEQGPNTGAPINIEISGDKFSELEQISKKVQAIISELPYIEDVRDDYMDAIPSIQIDIDRQKAALFGLSTNSIGYALKVAYNGVEVSTYREGGDDYDITVRLSKKDRNVTDVLHEFMIPTPSGQIVPLTTIAKIKYTGTIGDITRINHERVVTVMANVDEDNIPGPVLREQAEELLKEFNFPEGYGIKFTGEKEFQQEAEEFLQKAFMIAVLLIFLILVTLFNSVSQPLIIITSVLLSLGGAFLGLTIMKFPFGIIMSGVGIISLAGVVVNNAIVLIDYTNKLKEGGLKLHDAIISAGATRLRPVMLTAITTVLGLLPMVTGISFDFRSFSISLVSESSQFWQSMAIVVIFGLLVATFLTLVIVPTLYSLMHTFPKDVRKYFEKLKKIYWKPVNQYL